MEEFGQHSGIGHRIRAVRKARGIKSTAELATRIPGRLISGAVLRNIEAGVKTDISISQLLNIARALRVSPIFLLATIRDPNSKLDIPSLSQDFDQMTAIEFYDWVSGSSESIYEWTTAEDQSERSQLRAMKELEHNARERDRLTLLIDAAPNLEPIGEQPALGDEIEALTARRAEALRQIDRLSSYLRSAGWDVHRWN